MKEYIGKVCLDTSFYRENDSEDTVEDRLLEIVKDTEENSYDKMIEEEEDWSVLYHFSLQRQNVLEIVEFEKNNRVLEIGAECGALTGKLAEKTEKVTCIEKSKKKSLINAYRNKQCDNVEIKVGCYENIQNHLDEKYDVITVIGTMNEIVSLQSGENAYLNFIISLKSHLKKEGKLVLAMENKYGLKYWAGNSAPYTNEFFGGIMGHIGKPFSRNMLEKILRNAGFEKIKFYYPYPDYRFPTSIYSDNYLPQKGELVQNMCNYDGDRMYLFDETQAFDNLIEDGLFPLFSNSFLVLCE